MKKIFFYFSISLLFCSNVFADNQRTYKSFTWDTKQLPNNFEIKPKNIFESLQSIKDSNKKSEYETTEEYKKRIRNKKPITIGKNLNTDSIIALTGDAHNGLENSFMDISYNADKSILHIILTLSDLVNVDYGYDKNTRSFMLKESKETNNYTASNVYNTKAEVEEIKADRYMLLITNWKNFVLPKKRHNTLGFGAPIDIDLKMNKADAKKIKNTFSYSDNILSCLFIGNLKTPYSSIGFFHSSPTLDKPTEFTNHMKNIYLNVKEIWLYETSTGKILKKIKPLYK